MNRVRKKSRATQPQEGLVTPTHIKLQVKKNENTVGTKKWIYITFLSTEEDGGRGEGGGDNMRVLSLRPPTQLLQFYASLEKE